MAVSTPSPNPNPSQIPRDSISAAVSALLEWIQSQPKNQKAQLFEHDDLLYLSIALTKIPSKSRTNPYRIPIPHPLHPFDPQSTSICLLLDDRPSSPLPPAAALDQIRARSLPISSVIGLSDLESDYKPYESRRKLCDSYDLFFADRKILPLLPRLLGKHFFKRKKIPLAVDSSRAGWVEQIKSWCESSLLYLRSGSCSMLKIGRVNMGKDEIVENAVAAMEGAMGSVLKKWGNLRAVHVKTAESLALPVYQAVPQIGMKIEGVWDEEKGGSFAKGKKRGRDEERKGKKEKKGRIHDAGALDEDGGDGEVAGDDLGFEKTVKKKLKGGSDEVEGEKKGKKRKTDVVLNDEEEVEAKGMKKRGEKGGNSKERKRAGDEEDGNEQSVGIEVSKDKFKKKKMRGDAVVASVGAKKSKPNKKNGADELILNDELGVEKGIKKKVEKGAKAKEGKGVGDDEDVGVETGGSDEVEGEKKGKKRKTDVVLNDDEEVEAKGMKKKGKKGGNAKERKRAGDEEDGNEQNVGIEVSKDKIKKKKMRGDAVVASVGAKKSKPNKKKGADELILNDELGVEKGMKKKVEKGAKAKEGKGVGDDEDVGVETGGSELSNKRVKKTKMLEEAAVVASGRTKMNKPKNRRVKV